MRMYLVFDSPKGRRFQSIIERPPDPLVPSVSVQHLLTVLLGKESADHISSLVEQLKKKGSVR